MDITTSGRIVAEGDTPKSCKERGAVLLVELLEPLLTVVVVDAVTCVTVAVTVYPPVEVGRTTGVTTLVYPLDAQ